ncbi:hypothetical protein AUK04_00860 [Candidatus Roizmanbacteria bacterium CG2_30_33_16]|uniref:Peptidase M20 dimerisation domain-containing protein n=2 Tax=Candidatus Roizmaniibacteriota TaxID=1752723 RepID=A0A1J5HNB5_9BACT|nr:M20/M25/M40 family metallo-hydrolase [Candidatus Roizmanbacteria bacterium]OIP85899.1 MAG: hypothetical protein AUK04_00860 [Candidatus Roizmanbacteria bacterium CG2_30_33_16]PIQ72116.1 MAG: hypothetical protein COV86_04715 [Candidatus Roizmanbacteria bacterium CG11_big_fil_rev_8_21_14_0_20_35_14]
MEITNLFIKLVKIDSPSGFEDEISKYIVQFLKALKIKTAIDRFGNVYCRVGKKKTKPIFFSAHLDTVEPGRNIKPIIKNSFVQSDQTTILGADNKIAVATVLYTAQQIIKNHIAHRNFEVIFTRSEEIGNYGAVNFNTKLLKSDYGYCFDSSSPIGTIITASPFYERFNINIIRQSAHTSLPNKANNVIFPLIKFINKISLGRLNKDTVANIGVINLGSVRNTIPGNAFIQGEIRSFIEKKITTYKEQLIKKLEKSTKKYGVKFTQNFVQENTGYLHKDQVSEQLINNLKVIFNCMNVVPIAQSSWGVSDANIFNQCGKKCINLGNGSEFTHSVKERISIKSILNLQKLMLKLII